MTKNYGVASDAFRARLGVARPNVMSPAAAARPLCTTTGATASRTTSWTINGTFTGPLNETVNGTTMPAAGLRSALIQIDPTLRFTTVVDGAAFRPDGRPPV